MATPLKKTLADRRLIKPEKLKPFVLKTSIAQQIQQALFFHQQGQFEKAKGMYQGVLNLDPHQADALHLLGVLAYQTHQLEEALVLMGQALRYREDFAIAYSNRGNVYKELKRFEEALDDYDKALWINPNFVDAYSNRGDVLNELRQYQKALESCTKALALNPRFIDAYFNKALALQGLGRLDECIECCNAVLVLEGSNVQVHFLKGIALYELKRFELAVDSYCAAIQIQANHTKALCNLGLAQKALNRLDDAFKSYGQAVSLDPGFVEAYSNRAVLLRDLGRFSDSLKDCERAIAFDPGFRDAHYNQGLAFYELGRFEDSIRSFEQAVQIDSQFALAHWNKAITCLLTGHLEEGFIEFEWRWKTKNLDQEAIHRNYNKPIWSGQESIRDKTIFVYAEQGLGDTIQFCRYIKMLSDAGARVLMEVQTALINLMKSLTGVDEWVSKGQEPPEFDFHCPIMSLPLVFKTRLETIPSSISYLSVLPEKIMHWKARLDGESDEQEFKIAICWQGNKQGDVDKGRSFPVEMFQGIAALPGVRLISLQKNEGVEQLQNLSSRLNIETLGQDFDVGENAFLDSAAILQCVDLVITSDTALTHLAGSLGVRTWLALKYLPDWRWLLNREDSPWYPEHRLFRQDQRDDWSGVFKKMENELKVLLSQRHFNI